jgi:hypothetical protein
VVLVLVVAVVALSAVVLTGGARHASVRLRAVRLLVAAAVVQLGAGLLLPDSGAARAAALVLTAVLVGLFLAGNIGVAGAPLIAAGLLLNGLVIAANAAMPVSVAGARAAGLARAELRLPEDALREPLTAQTRLGFLGDVIPVAMPGLPQVVSPGDVLVAAGVGLLLTTARPRQTARRADRSTVLVSESTTLGSYS